MSVLFVVNDLLAQVILLDTTELTVELDRTGVFSVTKHSVSLGI